MIAIIYNIIIWIISIFISYGITNTFIKFLSLQSHYIHIITILISFIILLFISDILFKLGLHISEKKLETKNFIPDDAFQGRFIKFWVDVQSGRIAIIKRLFPFKLKIISANQVQECSIKMDKGNYTGYVIMELKIGNELLKCHTFSCPSERIPINSDPVFHGVELAKYFISLLYQAKSNLGGDDI